MIRRLWLVVIGLGLVAGLVLAVLVAGWFIPTALEEERTFIVPQGASLTSVAHKLEDEGFITSADRFLVGAKVLGGKAPIIAMRRRP